MARKNQNRKRTRRVAINWEEVQCQPNRENTNEQFPERSTQGSLKTFSKTDSTEYGKPVSEVCPKEFSQDSKQFPELRQTTTKLSPERHKTQFEETYPKLSKETYQIQFQKTNSTQGKGTNSKQGHVSHETVSNHSPLTFIPNTCEINLESKQKESHIDMKTDVSFNSTSKLWDSDEQLCDTSARSSLKLPETVTYNMMDNPNKTEVATNDNLKVESGGETDEMTKDVMTTEQMNDFSDPPVDLFLTAIEDKVKREDETEAFFEKNILDIYEKFNKKPDSMRQIQCCDRLVRTQNPANVPRSHKLYIFDIHPQVSAVQLKRELRCTDELEIFICTHKCNNFTSKFGYVAFSSPGALAKCLSAYQEYNKYFNLVDGILYMNYFKS